MGLFSIINGFINNDFSSLAFSFFESCYDRDYEIADKDYDECVYPFGLDPIWSISTNHLHFTNSLKMKASVILGINQMLLGLLIKAYNCINLNKRFKFYFEFLP